jgi:hypothetical protein
VADELAVALAAALPVTEEELAAEGELADAATLGEPVPADDALLHAAVNRAIAAVLRMAAAIGIAGGRARRGLRSTVEPSGIVGFMSPVLRAGR